MGTGAPGLGLSSAALTGTWEVSCVRSGKARTPTVTPMAPVSCGSCVPLAPTSPRFLPPYDSRVPVAPTSLWLPLCGCHGCGLCLLCTECGPNLDLCPKRLCSLQLFEDFHALGGTVPLPPRTTPFNCISWFPAGELGATNGTVFMRCFEGVN